MKYLNIKYCNVFAACILGVLTLLSCSNDEEEVNEWASNYVYIQTKDYLTVNPGVFNLMHNPLGIQGEVNYPFSIKTKYPVTKDLTVTLETNGDVASDKIEFSAKQVTIKSGEMSSEEITVTVPDWSFAFDTRVKNEYDITISISKIQDGDKDVRISNSQNNKLIKVTKASYTPVISTMPITWKTVDRSGWVASASQNYNNSYPPINAIDDNQNSTWFAYGVDNQGECWLNVQLDTPVNLAGFSITKENAYGGGYSVKQATIQILKEGATTWTIYKDIYAFSFSGSNPQYAIFDTVIEHVKEFRINILSPTDFTGLADFKLYTSN